MSPRRGTPRTTHRDRSTYAAVTAAMFLRGAWAFCQPRVPPVLLLLQTPGTGRKKRSQHPPLQITTGQARGARCKPILAQTPMHLRATGDACRDAAGRTATLATRCPLSAPGLGPHHCSREQNHVLAISWTSLVKMT